MEGLPEQIIAEFLREYRASGVYLRGRVAELAELLTSRDRQVAESASRAFFTALVERLADSFEPASVSLYNRTFAQVIQLCRQDPRADSLDRELTEFGLHTEEDLIARAEKLSDVSGLNMTGTWASKVQRVIVLSRVTLGADVAITSVILERMKHSFPQAEIVLLGGSKSAELFGGDQRIAFKEVDYRRTGTTVERLLTWIDLLERVRELTRGLRRGEYLIVDPDTRLTQLGLLPVTGTYGSLLSPESDAAEPGQKPDYVFFPSREYCSGTSQSLGELTSAWLDEVFGVGARTYPRVSLNRDDVESARKLVSGMRAGRSRPICAVNFGVGENQLKRVGGSFEASLVASLIQEGASIVLDKGAGGDEIKRADEAIAEVTKLEREGRRVRAIEIDERLMGTSSLEGLDAEVLVWKGRIGMLAALIGQSDLYIGYDSAGQHIAAALEVPCIDVFAGFSSRRMLDRWKPTGKGEVRVVPVDKSSDLDANELVTKVLGEARKMLKKN